MRFNWSSIALCLPFPWTFGFANLAEGMAVKLGLSLALDAGIPHFIIESDYLHVCQLLSSYVEDVSKWGCLVFSIKSELMSSFPCYVLFLPHSRNHLVSKVLSSQLNHVWLEDYHPSFLSDKNLKWFSLKTTSTVKDP